MISWWPQTVCNSLLTKVAYSCASELSSAKAQSGCRALQQALLLRLVAWQVGICCALPCLSLVCDA